MALKPGHVTLGESELLELVRTQPVPRHVAVIMDGNGRWATQRGLPRVAGHSEGVKSARTVVRTADTLGVGYLTLYAFSSENWSRPTDEVSTLMNLLERSIHQELPELMARNVRLRVIGEIAAGGFDFVGALTWAVAGERTPAVPNNTRAANTMTE